METDKVIENQVNSRKLVLGLVVTSPSDPVAWDVWSPQKECGKLFNIILTGSMTKIIYSPV